MNNRLQSLSPSPLLGKLIKQGIQLRRKMNPQNISASELQLKTLQKLLVRAEHTAFGQHYNFNNILSSARPMRSFSDTVPIHDYNLMFDEWWHRSLAQEPDICWPGLTRFFALSSGTSGAPTKHIPVSEEMITAMRRASLEMFLGLANLPQIDPMVFRKQMMLLGSTITLNDQGGFYIGDLSGINAGRIPVWLKPYYKPGKKIAAISDFETRIDEIAKKAHKWDIGVMSGIPSWVQLMLERVIEHNKLSHIHEIWPNLQSYASGGIAFEPYRKGFNKLLGHEIVILDTYLASEGFVAFQTNPDTSGMELLLGNGIYYEFVPFNDDNFTSDGELKPGAQAMTLDTIEEGKEYALLLTTCAGAWRYLIGDVVKFTDVENCEIRITGRTKHFLSITGEHLSVDNMNSGIQMIEEELNTQIREFTVCGIEYENLFAHKWYIGSDNPNLDKHLVAKLLDEKLCIVNADYATERRENALKAVIVEVLPAQVFYDWQAKSGKLGGQAKFPRVMKPERFAEWEQFVKERIQL